MPFIWSIARYCLELPSGRLLHFPAGDYYSQVSHWTGEIELELMRWAHSAWYTFGHLKITEWKQDDLRLLGMLRETPPKLPPTRHLQMYVSLLWFQSSWFHYVTEQMTGVS